MAGRYVFAILLGGVNPGERLKPLFNHALNTRASLFPGLVTVVDGVQTSDEICHSHRDITRVDSLVTAQVFGALLITPNRGQIGQSSPSFFPLPEPIDRLPRRATDIYLTEKELRVRPDGLPLFQGWLPGDKGVVITSDENDLMRLDAKRTRIMPVGRRLNFYKKNSTITVGY